MGFVPARKKLNFGPIGIIGLAGNSRQIFEFKGLMLPSPIPALLLFRGLVSFGRGKAGAGARLFCLRLFCQRSNPGYGKHFVCYESILTFGVKCHFSPNRDLRLPPSIIALPTSWENVAIKSGSCPIIGMCSRKKTNSGLASG